MLLGRLVHLVRTVHARPTVVNASDITAGRCRFEQAFSDDWGSTWESNWIAVDTRIDGSDRLAP
jgi:hypothetical protein